MVLKSNGGSWKTRWTVLPTTGGRAHLSSLDKNPDEHIRKYGLDLPAETCIGIQLTRILSYDIARYEFRNGHSPCKGHILLLHGYVLHSLCQASLISHLVSKGWHVTAFDWPGHGLSSGKRASICDFRIYSEVLSSIIDSFDQSARHPLHLIAHSTGCSAWIEYVHHSQSKPFDKVILVSPLIRNAAWRSSLLGIWIADRMGWNLVPRIFRRSSHDPAYLRLMRNDPLSPWVIPIQWSRSLIRWQSLLASSPAHGLNATVFQGTRDSVIDWRFGLRTIRRLFPHVSVVQWKGQRHDLLNEGYPIRTRVFDAVDRIVSLETHPTPDSFGA
ncbi:MAG: alpha/beta hydrolase [Opitutales bacterium]|nr:alpha/beta hydrolase [Opitutales bacterium]